MRTPGTTRQRLYYPPPLRAPLDDRRWYAARLGFTPAPWKRCDRTAIRTPRVCMSVSVCVCVCVCGQVDADGALRFDGVVAADLRLSDVPDLLSVRAVAIACRRVCCVVAASISGPVPAANALLTVLPCFVCDTGRRTRRWQQPHTPCPCSS